MIRQLSADSNLVWCILGMRLQRCQRCRQGSGLQSLKLLINQQLLNICCSNQARAENAHPQKPGYIVIQVAIGSNNGKYLNTRLEFPIMRVSLLAVQHRFIYDLKVVALDAVEAWTFRNLKLLEVLSCHFELVQPVLHPLWQQQICSQVFNIFTLI